MRILVMFDLPSIRADQRREYRIFRKWLIKEGFIMMQESIYSKLSLNMNSANLIIKNVKDRKTTEGIIQTLVISERQFNNIEFIVGTPQKEIIDSTERVVII